MLSDVERAVYLLIGLIIGVILHEFMHGFVAYKSGDRTAKNAGRLTLDPLAHIDPFGTLLLPGMMFLLSALGGGGIIFGYAKPVPINPFAFRKRSAIIWVSLAGPLTNLLIGVVFFGLTKLTYELGDLNSDVILKVLFTLIGIGYINVLLFVFNLIPIPPLDGSRVVAYFLKGEARSFYASIEPYGFIIILVLLFFFSIVLSSVTRSLCDLLFHIYGLPSVLFNLFWS